MRSLGIAVALALVLAWPAAATVIEVPVPELTGTYSCAEPPFTGCFQTIAIHLPAIPSVIHSVSLRVNGTTSFSVVTCDTGLPHPFNTSFYAELFEPGQSGNYWTAEHLNAEAGAVAYTQQFDPGPYTNSTWAFLLDGSAALYFTINASSPIPECLVTGPSDSTTLGNVTLLVDGEFPTATRNFSWGRLKVIYR